MKTLRLTFAALAFAGLPPAAAAEWSGTPRVTSLFPRGAACGESVDVIFTGTGLGDCRGMLCLTTDKIQLTGFNPVTPDPKDRDRNSPDKIASATLRITEDCPPGRHVLRIATASGFADAVLFHVGTLPSRTEQETQDRPASGRGATDTNGTLETAETIPAGVTVNGNLDGMEADFYRIECHKGELLSVELEAARLCASERDDGFQARLTVQDATGRELATCEETALLLTDPSLSLTAPADGPLFVSVRPALPPSNTRNLFPYRLHAGPFLRPQGVYPAGGNPGQKLTVRLTGLPDGVPDTTTVVLPERTGEFAWRASPGTPTANCLRSLPGPNVLENPADSGEPATVPDKALPFAANGILTTDGETDRFRFTAAKGTRISFRLYGQELGSPIDARLTITAAGDSKAKPQSADDCDDAALGLFDTGTVREKLDPFLQFTAPADGAYILAVSDTRGAGSQDAIYRVEATAPATGFLTTLLPVERNARLVRNAVALAPGNRAVCTLAARPLPGTELSGEFELVACGLPEGVTMSAPRFSVPESRIPVAFTAREGLPVSVSGITLTARPAGADKADPALVTRFRQTIPLVQAQNDALEFVTVDQLALAITEPAPFRLEVGPPPGPLVKNGELELDITLHRAPGYTGEVEVVMENPPRGVTPAQGIVFRGEESTQSFRLAADNNAAPDERPLILTARNRSGDGRTGAGKIFTASNSVPIEVSDPWLKVNFARARVERGAETTITAKVERLRDLPGDARVSLIRLPRGTAMKGGPVTLNPDNTLTFTLSAAPDALTGTFRGMTCEVLVAAGDRTLKQVTGYGTLRIDPARAR